MKPPVTTPREWAGIICFMTAPTLLILLIGFGIEYVRNENKSRGR